METMAQLIVLAAAEDHSAMEVLDSRCRRPLIAMFVKHGADDSTAEDLCQMTMLKVWLGAAQYDPMKCVDPMNWVFSIGYRTFLDHCRSERRRRSVMRYDVAVDPAVEDRRFTSVDHSDLRPVVQKIVSGRFSYADDAVSDLFDGLSASESASVRSVTPSAARWRRYMIIDALETSKEFANAFG